jgi:hypothetical protein
MTRGIVTEIQLAFELLAEDHPEASLDRLLELAAERVRHFHPGLALTTEDVRCAVVTRAADDQMVAVD